MPETDKVRENKARRWAARLGYRMCKSRAKQLHVNDRGEYQLVDAYKNTVEWGVNYELSLDDVEAILREQESKLRLYPTTVHNIAKAAGARLIGPHYRNGRYTLHFNGGYHPNLTAEEVADALTAKAADSAA